MSYFHNHHPQLHDAFAYRLATRSGLSGSDREKELSPGRYHSDPHHFQSGLKRLNNALDDVITLIEQEASNGRTGLENELLLKFKGWRRELDSVRTGVGNRMGHGMDMGDGVSAESGGMFTD